MKSRENLLGAWAVLSGVIIAVILGVVVFIYRNQANIADTYNIWIYSLLAIMGLFIGFVSISTDSRESTTFLLATVSLVIVSALGQNNLIVVREVGILMVSILNTLLTLLIPATVIVAIKTLFSFANVG